MSSEAMRQAFSNKYVIQDDGRQHVFWMLRFVDADLFRGDLIADYFQSIAPTGYTVLYRIAARLGADPIYFSKLLPMALGFLTTVFCFAVTMKLFPVPSAAFVASLLLNESLWMRNGIVSGTPRAFISPLFLMFLFFALNNSVVGTVATIALMALFFPSIMFIALGTLCLRLIKFDARRLRLSRDRRDYILCATALVVAAVVLLPFARRSSSFGPVVSAAEARNMPEFLARGRMVVFRQGFWQRWLTGSHTGMFASAVFYPYTMLLGLTLPLLLLLRRRLPAVERISGTISLIPRVILASLAMYFAANALLFRLYLPSRFTVSSFRIILALAAGISAIVLLDAVFRWATSDTTSLSFYRALMAMAAVVVLIAALWLPRYLNGTWVDTRYKTGQSAELYEFLSHEPKDTVIASLASEADNIPAFAARPVLVARETALPFHKGYYSQIRQRAEDLIDAQYTPDLARLQQFVRDYRVGFFLVDRDAFEPGYVLSDKWLMQYRPAARNAIDHLSNGAVPALAKLVDRCSVLETNNMKLIPSDCILKAP